MAPRSTGLVARKCKLELDVGEVDGDVDTRLEKINRAAKDAAEHVVIFYLTDYVLHSKAPVVKDRVEVNLLLRQKSVVGLDVLHEDVPVRLESAIAESPLPRQQGGGIHVENNVVWVST